MKIIVKCSLDGFYYAELIQGHQIFHLSYQGSKPDVEWYAKMFRIALRRHNKEMKKKWQHLKTR